MFERYNINDLFLASIDVTYPENDMGDTDIGGILKTGISGYGYLTILGKFGDRYFDLQHMSRRITDTRDPNTVSYTINYMQPLSKYYTQEGKKKDTFSRRKAIREAEKHYNTVHREHLTQMEEQDTSKSL